MINKRMSIQRRVTRHILATRNYKEKLNDLYAGAAGSVTISELRDYRSGIAFYEDLLENENQSYEDFMEERDGD
jgi:hypothetical protein